MSYIGASPTSVAFLTDQFSGNGTTTAFTMSVAPATTTSILVAITGVVQDPTTYSVVGTTLTFSAAPPSGTGNISVRYMGIPASGVTTTAYRTVTDFTATAGQTTFTPASYTVGYINVYRNGLRLGAADFTATNGTTVVLAAAASAGDLVTTESFYVSSVLNAIPATAGAVNSTYLSGGSALANIGAGGVTQTYLGANVAGNGPAFSAYPSANQTITSAVATKVTLDTEQFDTNNNFASSRFTPTVAGYYQISLCFQPEPSTSMTRVILCLYKNGSLYSVPQDFDGLKGASATGALVNKTSGSQLIYLNGSTDYVEMYVYIFAATPVIGNGSQNTWMTGFLARAA